MKKLDWYFYRLKSMKPSEIPYRINQQLSRFIKKQIFFKNKLFYITNEIKHVDINNNDFNQRVNSLLSLEHLSQIDKMDNFKIFNSFINLDNKIDWHQGWPKNNFSYDISFKDKDDIGEIRYTWEINRLQFLLLLALDFKQAESNEVLEKIEFHFYDWVKENPFLRGVNWSSPMEIAIRAYQWLLVYRVLKDIDSVEQNFLNDLIQSIINSMNYVMKNLSLHSSANNHLILEAAISSMIGYCLDPIYKQNWFKKGYKIIEKELPLQVYDDGVNKEQAVHYHAFVLDMMLQLNIFFVKNSIKPISEKLIYKMVRFLANLKSGVSVIEIGDSDDAKIIAPFSKCNYYDYILELASVYYNEMFINQPNQSDLAQSILGKLNRVPEEKIELENLSIFKEGGYSFIKNKSTFLIFDSGALGFGSIAAHGHADALSIMLNYDGKPLLVDSGTYIYNIEKEWRNYFRKTSSHNTLSYQSSDQSEMKGPFLWAKKAHSELLDFGKNEKYYYLKGNHDGYKPHLHEREITHLINQEITIIADYFSEQATIHYLFDSNVKVVEVNEKLLKLNDELYMYTSIPFRIVDKYISKAFMSKESTKGIDIFNDFKENPVIYTIISQKPIEMKGNILYYEGENYIYENYHSIRGV
jgi:hypothetical protein